MFYALDQRWREGVYGCPSFSLCLQNLESFSGGGGSHAIFLGNSTSYFVTGSV